MGRGSAALGEQPADRGRDGRQMELRHRPAVHGRDGVGIRFVVSFRRENPRKRTPFSNWATTRGFSSSARARGALKGWGPLSESVVPRAAMADGATGAAGLERRVRDAPRVPQLQEDAPAGPVHRGDEQARAGALRSTRRSAPSARSPLRRGCASSAPSDRDERGPAEPLREGRAGDPRQAQARDHRVRGGARASGAPRRRDRAYARRRASLADGVGDGQFVRRRAAARSKAQSTI